MVYSIGADRPASDAPFTKESSPLQWAQWAKDNAPFQSVSTKVWRTWVAGLPQSWSHLAKATSLTHDEARRVLVWGPPTAAREVFAWAVAHGYGVTISDE